MTRRQKKPYVEYTAYYCYFLLHEKKVVSKLIVNDSMKCVFLCGMYKEDVLKLVR